MSVAQQPVVFLRVNGQHLAEGFRMILRVKGLGQKSVLLSFDDAQLIVEFGDLRVRADAEGTWPGTAKVIAAGMRKIARAFPPNAGSVIVSIRDDELRFGPSLEAEATLKTKCQWLPA